MNDDDAPSKSRRQQFQRTLISVVTCLAVAWATWVLWFVQPGVALGFLVFCGLLVWRTRRRGWAPIMALLASTLALAWWLGLPARNDRTWEPDVAHMTWGEFNGDSVTLHNYRDFEWNSEVDFTPRWTTKTVTLSRLAQMSLIMTYWSSPHVCHTMVSFDFGPDGRVCVSIEARREQGEEYSALGGMFRQYELIYVFGEERDLVHLRTGVRPSNDVYLFHLEASPAIAQAMFLDYLRSTNALRERPAWYHSIATNCSTTIRTHLRRANVKAPWDWRVLANGHADEYLYEFGYVSRDLPLPELKRRSRLAPTLPTIETPSEFSARIRAGLPGH